MARHRSFSFEFKRQVAEDFLEGRAGMHELARRYSLSRNLIRQTHGRYRQIERTNSKASNNIPLWPRCYNHHVLTCKHEETAIFSSRGGNRTGFLTEKYKL